MSDMYKICDCGDGRKNKSVGFDEEGNPIVVDTECEDCSGTGFLLTGKVDSTDILDKCNDILDKCNDIFEKVSE